MGGSEFKKNLMAVIGQDDGAPIAILNRNQPVFYAVPAIVCEALLDKLETLELAKIIEQRRNSPETKVTIEELYSGL